MMPKRLGASVCNALRVIHRDAEKVMHPSRGGVGQVVENGWTPYRAGHTLIDSPSPLSSLWFNDNFGYVLPAVHSSQDDLAAAQQAEEQEQHGVLAGQRSLGFGATAELFVDALQGVSRPQRLPL